MNQPISRRAMLARTAAAGVAAAVPLPAEPVTAGLPVMIQPPMTDWPW